MFVLGCIVFFIVWILLWGMTSNLDVVVSWFINFLQSIAHTVCLVSPASIFIVNILILEFARPKLLRIHKHLLSRWPKEFDSTGTSAVYSYVLPSLIAAKDPSLQSVKAAQVLTRTKNDNEDSPQPKYWVFPSC